MTVPDIPFTPCSHKVRTLPQQPFRAAPGGRDAARPHGGTQSLAGGPTIPRIPFIEARWPDALPKPDAVKARLSAFLKTLRAHAAPEGGEAARAQGAPRAVDAGCRDRASGWHDDPTFRHPRLALADRLRIRRRSGAYCTRAAATGLSHLSREAREQLAVLRHGATLVVISTEHCADEIAAALHEEMPWMARATEYVWHAMRASVRDGDLGLRLPPMLLVGPPGIGKSHWARALGRHLGMPTNVIDAAGEPASWAVVGLQKGWGSNGPGRVMETILARLVANPLVVIDEVEKAGDVRTTKDASYSLTHALPPLLERSTAASWSCPYFRVRFDLPWIGWVLTVNDTGRLTAPLLSRVPPLRLPDLTAAPLMAFAERQARGRGLPEEVARAIVAALADASADRRPSLRKVMRMAARAETVGAMPILH